MTTASDLYQPPVRWHCKCQFESARFREVSAGIQQAGAPMGGGGACVRHQRSGQEDNHPMKLFLGGDVMLGRGVDQILPHPGDPRLHESVVRNAQDYVRLAEAVNGPMARPVAFPYVWGDALAELTRRAPDARIVNLETAVTTSDEPWPHKGIHYRMHPDNVRCLVSAKIDCCVLANNHVLDWGYAGLRETVATLRQVGIATAGAGRNRVEASTPALIDLGPRGRVAVLALGSGTSGIPGSWAATPDRPGVNLLPDFSDGTVEEVAAGVRAVKRPGTIVVASIHWGDNWGYGVPGHQRGFARRLIDEAGVDLVHGHSSHHPKAIEVYRGHLILYGCGDVLDDYEGIGGSEEFRGELRLLYFPRLDVSTGTLRRLTMTPVRLRRFRIQRASLDEARWLGVTLTREGQPFGTRARLSEDGTLTLEATDEVRM